MAEPLDRVAVDVQSRQIRQGRCQRVQPRLDRATIRRDAQRLSDARTRLFERELMMLVDMRAVLNDSQWDRMRNQLDRFGAQQQQLRPRPNGLRKNQR